MIDLIRDHPLWITLWLLIIMNGISEIGKRK
jgi:hypothetical protein